MKLNLIKSRIIELWIARDLVDNNLYLYTKEPKLSEEIEGFWVCSQYGNNTVNVIALPSEYFPEVTFKNSPKQIKIELI